VRPIRLEVEGFTSFREKQSIDFSGLDLFAITGPTGAGKSSLIDALVFALYGQVPRVGDDYKQLISHGAERLNVLLEFEVGRSRHRYRIARTARPAGASKQRLERLEGEEARPLADKAREIKARIEEILGLDYDGFTRAVVLPQGQFDEFLKGEPKERRKILVSLLDLGIYDAIQRLANQKGTEARKEAAFIAEQLERDFADATPGTLEARTEELARAEGESAALEKALSTLGDGLALAQRLRATREEIETQARDAAQEEKKRAAADDVLTRGDETRAGIESELQDLAGQIDGLGLDPEWQRTLLTAKPRAEQLTSVRAQLEKLAEARAERQSTLEAGQAALAAAETAVPSAEGAQREAETDLRAAREVREQIHRQFAAAALRRGLEIGEPCPVCEQTVPAVPKAEAPALEAAEARVARAEKAARAAAAAAEKARLELQKAEAGAAGLKRELARLEEQVRDLTSSGAALADGLCGAGFGADDVADAPRLLEEIQSELKTLDAARRAKDDLESKRQTIEQRRSGLQAELAAATARRDGAGARLEEISARQQAAATAVGQTEPALRELAAREGWDDLEGRGARRDEVAVLEARRSARQQESRELAARVGALRGEVERLGQKIVRATELREKKVRLDSDAALLKTLADHLRANELVAWIQEEALRRLAEDGSRHLEMLSQGRYALRLGSGEAAGAGARAEQDFYVVDRWNADGVRSVRTLSGGETFLASLALALALAESLARLSTGSRAVEALESLFLDEGFGTLDGETLDTVVSALDALHGGQRLVGVVTHVRELAERLPARLEVRRTGGSTARATVV
jgi:exonuclease SbcC